MIREKGTIKMEEVTDLTELVRRAAQEQKEFARKQRITECKKKRKKKAQIVINIIVK